jgi:hypothetical protein
VRVRGTTLTPTWRPSHRAVHTRDAKRDVEETCSVSHRHIGEESVCERRRRTVVDQPEQHPIGPAPSASGPLRKLERQMSRLVGTGCNDERVTGDVGATDHGRARASGCEGNCVQDTRRE